MHVHGNFIMLLKLAIDCMIHNGINVYVREVVVDGAAEIKINDYIILLLNHGRNYTLDICLFYAKHIKLVLLNVLYIISE